MRKRTTLIVLGVLITIMAILGVLPYSGLTRTQRDKVVQQFDIHVDNYQASHGGRFPSTLQELASSQPLEPDLTKLIQRKQVFYTPPENLPGNDAQTNHIDGTWELRIDGITCSIGPAMY